MAPPSSGRSSGRKTAGQSDDTKVRLITHFFAKSSPSSSKAVTAGINGGVGSAPAAHVQQVMSKRSELEQQQQQQDGDGDGHMGKETFFPSPKLDGLAPPRQLPPMSSSAVVRSDSTSSSNLSSVPPSPPKRKDKARAVESSSSSSVEEEDTVMAAPRKNNALAPPASRGRSTTPGQGSQRFLGVRVPPVPAHIRRARSTLSPQPAPARRDQDSDSDDLEDADEFMNKLIDATAPSPAKAAPKKVIFADPGPRKSTRVVSGSRTDDDKPSPFSASTTADSGKFSILSMIRADRAEERSKAAVGAVATLELPDEIMDDPFARPPRPVTPPPGELGVGAHPWTPSPSRVRIQDVDLAALDKMPAVAAAAISGDSSAASGKQIRKTVELVKNSAAVLSQLEQETIIDKAARTCWTWHETGTVRPFELGTDVDGAIPEALRDGLESWTLFPADLLSFLWEPLPSQDLQALLSVALDPTVDERLGDRILQSLSSTRSADADVVCDVVLGCFKSVGTRSDVVAPPQEDAMQVDGLDGTATITAFDRARVVVRALRVLDWLVASSQDAAAVVFSRLAHPLLRLGLDPTSNDKVRPVLVELLDHLVSPLLGASQCRPVFDEYMRLASSQDWRGKREVLRLIPVGSFEGQTLRCWIALAMLLPHAADADADLTVRPPVALIYSSLCEHLSASSVDMPPPGSNDDPTASPESGTSTPIAPFSPRIPPPSTGRLRAPFNLVGSDAAGAKATGPAVAILTNAIRDVAGYADVADEPGLKRVSHTWFKALRHALGHFDASIRTSVRGDPERNKVKNAVTRLEHSLVYQTAFVNEERPDAMKLFLERGADQRSASETVMARAQSTELRKPAVLKSREGSVAFGQQRSGTPSTGV